MQWRLYLILAASACGFVSGAPYQDNVTYEPTWDSLDSRPLPQWYDDAKLGIFIHWGVYAVPSFGSEWFWSNWKGSNNQEYIDFMEKNYKPGFTYQDFASDFTAEFYDPEEWAELFQSSGAKYVVLTSKHHEGYTMWPSKYSFSWNSVDVGPQRDLLGDLAAALREKTDLRFGVYHSLYEWFNPIYISDKANNYTTQEFVNTKTMPELYELVNTYQPEIVWSDGEWEASDEYWTSKEFIAWLFNESPVRETVVTNDRWGTGTLCTHGSFYTCTDRYNPGVLQPHKWENCLTIDKVSWGYRRNAKLEDYMTTHELIEQLVSTVSCNGNMLMNVGPTKDGLIMPIYAERLRDMGTWLQINGEAIYASQPWTAQEDPTTTGVWYTKSGNNSSEVFVYATLLNWPTDNVITLGAPSLSENSVITMLGVDGTLEWQTLENGIAITLPDKQHVANDWAWVLRFTNVQN
ncbi:alpha-L-fucosidase-like [Schistocerca serialis cubense]|uniref:alpha-L-fucosidase-like n=1 Tax=Schistocerca serialis cubense TaxID=2023355 RepID=UPI00214E8B72|nr:alpha-L-fucosidase-like [Schistocerca serialis cubense]